MNNYIENDYAERFYCMIIYEIFTNLTFRRKKYKFERVPFGKKNCRTKDGIRIFKPFKVQKPCFSLGKQQKNMFRDVFVMLFGM